MRPIRLKDFQDTHWPLGDQLVLSHINGIIATQAAAFAEFGIKKGLHVAHMMGQFSHECGAGLEMVENLNFSPKRMVEVWPKHFPTLAAAAPYAHNPVRLGNFIYGHAEHPDLGNVKDSDGFTFRGRGFIQTTGRDGYAALGKLVGLDLIGHPEMLIMPAHAFRCGVAEFVHYPGILAACDRGDIRAVTKLINGGYTDLASRVEWTERWIRQMEKA